MTVWYDVQHDKYSKRFYVKVGPKETSWDLAFSTMLKELLNWDYKGLVFNVHLFIDAGIVNFIPAK